MADFSTSVSLGLMRKTAPFIVFRMAVYFGIAAAYVIATGTGAGLGYGVGAFWQDDTQASMAFWGGTIGFGLTAGILYFLREYILYIVKAGHIAVMVEALDGRELPGGQGQIAYARDIVTKHFAQSNVLFALDQLVKGVIAAVTGLLEGLLSILPIPGLDKFMMVIRAYLRVAVGLLDEVMLAHTFRTRSDNPYAASREALVLYAQNAKGMLINAVWVTALVWALSFVVFLVMLAPAGFVAWAMPGEWSATGIVFAVLFAWAAKAALIEPFAIACMLQVYIKLTAGQTPNPEWEAKLDRASAKFKSLGQRALDWTGRRFGGGGLPTGKPDTDAT